jgi:hypothetical protein
MKTQQNNANKKIPISPCLPTKKKKNTIEQHNIKEKTKPINPSDPRLLFFLNMKRVVRKRSKFYLITEKTKKKT